LYIKSLSISNLRCFEKTRLDFHYPARQERASPLANINLLLGNNGAGKTTVLKAIALAALSPVIEGAGYVPYHLIRQGHKSALVEADLILHEQDVGALAASEALVERVRTRVTGIRDYERLEAEHKKETLWEGMYDEQSPAFLMVGYGATRRVESADYASPQTLRKSRRLRYQRVAGLFEEQITLTPLSAWLPFISPRNTSRFEEILDIFRKLLPVETGFEGTIEAGEALFEQFGQLVPFSAMSDGYRAYIGWISDLLYHLVMTCPPHLNLLDMRGVVLVDEVDLHLHPAWQREVVSMLSAALPKMQFILSTHSPIVTGALSHSNIFVMEQTADGSSTVQQFEERVFGINAEQVLLSSYFNLQTTRTPRFEEQLREIEGRAWNGDAGAAVEFLKKLAGSPPTNLPAVATHQPTHQRKT
jgi:predicted ATPase